jgi:hypothetical protein
MTKTKAQAKGGCVLLATFRILCFKFVSNFGFRISSFRAQPGGGGKWN